MDHDFHNQLIQVRHVRRLEAIIDTLTHSLNRAGLGHNDGWAKLGDAIADLNDLHDDMESVAIDAEAWPEVDETAIQWKRVG